MKLVIGNKHFKKSYEISGIEPLEVGKKLKARAYDGDCGIKECNVHLCINTPAELKYFKQGGLLPAFVKGVLENKKSRQL